MGRRSQRTVSPVCQRCKVRSLRPNTSQALARRAPAVTDSFSKTITCSRSSWVVMRPLPPRAPGTFFAEPTALRLLLRPCLYATIHVQGFGFLLSMYARPALLHACLLSHHGYKNQFSTAPCLLYTSPSPRD